MATPLFFLTKKSNVRHSSQFNAAHVDNTLFCCTDWSSSKNSLQIRRSDFEYKALIWNLVA